jgi:hypothetical protein
MDANNNNNTPTTKLVVAEMAHGFMIFRVAVDGTGSVDLARGQRVDTIHRSKRAAALAARKIAAATGEQITN